MTGRGLKRRIILKTLGMLLCVLPPLFATLAYFPLWVGEGSGVRMISGLALALCIVAYAPLLRGIKRLLSSPASFVVWGVIFLFFLMTSAIAHEVKVISFTGFVSNLAGAVLFKLAGGNTNEG